MQILGIRIKKREAKFKTIRIMVTQIEMGHLATIHHQRAIKKLIFGLEKLFLSGEITLEPLPETDIDPGNPESKCPDIVLQDEENATVPVIIEVATKKQG